MARLRLGLRDKTNFHYAMLVAGWFEAGCRPAASWNLAYRLDR